MNENLFFPEREYTSEDVNFVKMKADEINYSPAMAVEESTPKVANECPPPSMFSNCRCEIETRVFKMDDPIVNETIEKKPVEQTPKKVFKSFAELIRLKK